MGTPYVRIAEDTSVLPMSLTCLQVLFDSRHFTRQLVLEAVEINDGPLVGAATDFVDTIVGADFPGQPAPVDRRQARVYANGQTGRCGGGVAEFRRNKHPFSRLL